MWVWDVEIDQLYFLFGLCKRLQNEVCLSWNKCFLCYFVSLYSVVSTGAVNHVESFVFEMTFCVLSGTLDLNNSVLFGVTCIELLSRSSDGSEVCWSLATACSSTTTTGRWC